MSLARRQDNLCHNPASVENTGLDNGSSVNVREPLSKSSAVGALKLNFGEDMRLSACERDVLGRPASRAGIARLATVYWEG
ncbi:hypothetical protein DENIT_90220 [Pseudomonas veronii]|nr:hypothetical protein DENIT_90220 [Pseudomonas veronii]